MNVVKPTAEINNALSRHTCYFSWRWSEPTNHSSLWLFNYRI